MHTAINDVSGLPTVNVYDEIAEGYDAMLGDDFSNLTFSAFSNIIKLRMNGRPIKRHLDLACGTGTFVTRLWRNNNARCFGMDISHAQVKVARAKARCVSADITFLVGDVLDTPYPNDLDLVSMTFDALNHMRHVADWRLICHKVRRSLLPGGIFVFDVNTPRRLLHDWRVPEVLINQHGTYVQVPFPHRIRRFGVSRQILMELYLGRESKPKCGRALIEQLALRPEFIVRLLRRAGFSTIEQFDPGSRVRAAHIFLKNRAFYVAC